MRGVNKILETDATEIALGERKVETLARRLRISGKLRKWRHKVMLKTGRLVANL